MFTADHVLFICSKHWNSYFRFESVEACSFNRQIPEITGEIIRKSEAPAVGHHFRHGLDIYIHDFRMEAAVVKR